MTIKPSSFLAAIWLVSAAALLSVSAYEAGGLNSNKTGSFVMMNVGDHGICAGVHIGKGRVLTAAHCVDDKITVTTDKQFTSRPATLLFSNKKLDVALYAVTGLADTARSAQLSCEPLYVGERVHIAGHPLDWNWTETWGRIANVHIPSDTWTSVVLVDATIGPGNSGGPMFDSAGRVRGIVVGGYGVSIGIGAFIPTRYNFAVPAQAICQFVAP